MAILTYATKGNWSYDLITMGVDDEFKLHIRAATALEDKTSINDEQYE